MILMLDVGKRKAFASLGRYIMDGSGTSSTGASGPGSVARCQACGMENVAGTAFCVNCGASLAGTYTQAPAPSAPGMPISQVPTQMPTGPPAGLQAQPVQFSPVVGTQAQPVAFIQEVRGIRNNGLCVASMVLGIIGLVFFWLPFAGIVLGLLAVILAAVGIPSSTSRGEMGKGMGIAGLVTGLVDLGLNLAFLILVWGIFSTATRYYPY